MTGYQDDLEAINRYFRSFKDEKMTYAAKELQTSWKKWFDSLTWYQKNIEKAIWLEGRNRRNAFNIAMGYHLNPNAVTSEDIWTDGPPGTVVADVVSTAGSATTTYLPFLILGVGVAGLGVSYFYLSPFMKR